MHRRPTYVTPPLHRLIEAAKDPGVLHTDLALRTFVEGTTIPLFGQVRGRQVAFGTGTLFTISRHTFLVTARHVLQEIPAGTFMLPMDRSARVVVGPGEVTELTSTERTLDIAVMELHDRGAVKTLSKAWTILSDKHLGAAQDNGAPFLVAGYPTATNMRPSAPGRPLVIATSRIPAPPEASDSVVLPEWDLVLEWRHNSLLFPTAQEVESPRLPGMSGASVWQLQPPREGGVWSPSSELRVVAVQVSEKHGEFIRAQQWTLLWSAMKAISRRAATKMRYAIEMNNLYGV